MSSPTVSPDLGIGMTWASCKHLLTERFRRSAPWRAATQESEPHEENT